MDVRDIENSELEERVFEYLWGHFDLERTERAIEHKIETEDGIYENEEGVYTGIVEIYIPDSAGTYMAKEIIEMFNFQVDVEEYEDYEKQPSYRYIASNIVNYANLWLEEAMNLDDVNVFFTLSGDFKLKIYIREGDYRRMVG
jgi:hypothetical protein